MRIGVIGRADPTGLGSMTVDFCDNVEVERAFIINRDSRGPTDSNRVRANYVLTAMWPTSGVDIPQFERFFRGEVDIIVGFETFYSRDVVPACVKAGIKTVMFPMWECSPAELAACDLLIAVTDADKKRFPDAVRMDWPMEPMELIRRPNNPPTKFVCNGGSLGLHNRNNFDAAAMAVRNGCFDGTNARLTLRCHDEQYARSFAAGHPKIDVLPRAEKRIELYSRADVIIHLQAFDGLSLPQLEAAACGVPMIVMDIEGYKAYPHRCAARKSIDENGPHSFDLYDMMGQSVKYWRPDIEDLARMLRGMAMGEILLQSSPKPPTWDEFMEGFHEELSTLCRPAS